MSSSNPTDGAQKNRPSLETTLKALTALLVLITASTGLFAKQQTGQKEKVEGQNSQLQEQVDTLSQKVAALQQQLDAQTATTSESPGTGTSGSTGNLSDAAFTRQLTLTHSPGSYAGIYINEGKVANNDGSTDIYYELENNRYQLRNGFSTISLPIQGSVDKTKCKNAIDTTPTERPLTALRAGLQFCASADSEGVALLRVVRPPDQDGTMVVAETFWSLG